MIFKSGIVHCPRTWSYILYTFILAYLGLLRQSKAVYWLTITFIQNFLLNNLHLLYFNLSSTCDLFFFLFLTIFYFYFIEMLFKLFRSFNVTNFLKKMTFNFTKKYGIWILFKIIYFHSSILKIFRFLNSLSYFNLFFNLIFILFIHI